MKIPLPPDLTEATRLTRQGRLSAATSLIQRLLGAKSPATKSPAAKPPARPVRAVPAGTLTLPRSSDAIGAPHIAPVVPGSFTLHAYHGSAGSREYKLYVPASYRGEPCPLIVMLHGCTQSADDFAGGTGMNAVADRLGCLVAYPIQSTGANKSRCWNWFRTKDQQRGNGEPAIVVGIVAQIGHDVSVDSKRVYVAGLSAGGAAAAVLGARYPDVFAAIGVHSGLACGAAHDVLSAFTAMRSGGRQRRPVDAAASENAPEIDVPVILFHGDADTTVHPANADRIVAETAAATLRASTETLRTSGHSSTRVTYSDDRGRMVLERWTVHGAGHAWSGGNAGHSYTDPAGPNASQAMIEFFLEHER